jgi:mycothiol synthase
MSPASRDTRLGPFCFRALRRADLGSWAQLCRAAARAEGLEASETEEDLAAQLAFPQLDLARDSFVGVTPNGELAGIAVVLSLPSAGEFHSVTMLGAVHPAYRRWGLGGRLLAWQEGRGGDLHRERFPGVPGLLMIRCSIGATESRALYERAGWRAVQWIDDMGRSLADDPPLAAPRSPDGMAVVAVDRVRDSERVRKAHNEAFRDGWGFSELTAGFWHTQRMGSPRFRPDLSGIAVTPCGGIAAYVLTYTAGSTGERIALGQIGTRPAYRGGSRRHSSPRR